MGQDHDAKCNRPFLSREQGQISIGEGVNVMYAHILLMKFLLDTTPILGVCFVAAILHVFAH